MALGGSNYLKCLYGTILYMPLLSHFVRQHRDPNPRGGFFGFVYFPYKGITNLCDIGTDHMICLFHIWVMGHQKLAKIPGDIHHIRIYRPAKRALLAERQKRDRSVYLSDLDQYTKKYVTSRSKLHYTLKGS